MTNTDWIAFITSAASFVIALGTAIGTLWYQKHRFKIEEKEHAEKYDTPEKRASRWSLGLPHPPSPTYEENNIDIGLPYQAGAPIRNPELFYGREEQISCALDCVTGEDMASMFILGARRSGKTSFFHQLSHILSPDHYPQIVPVFLDAQIPISSEKNFYAYMFREASAGLSARSKSNSCPPEIPTEVEFNTLCTFLERASGQGWRFVFMLDEFEKLIDNEQISGEDLFASLRSLILKVHISWIPASFREVYMPGTKTSPFTNIFQETTYLGPLSETEACLLVSEPAARAGYPFNNEDILLILHLAGRMPFLLQKACLLLYKSHRAGKDRKTSRDDLETDFKLQSQSYFQAQLSILFPKEKEALFQLACHKDVTEYLQILDFLERYGFVEKNAGGYKILGRTFENYLYQQALDAGVTFP